MSTLVKNTLLSYPATVPFFELPPHTCTSRLSFFAKSSLTTSKFAHGRVCSAYVVTLALSYCHNDYDHVDVATLHGYILMYAICLNIDIWRVGLWRNFICQLLLAQCEVVHDGVPSIYNHLFCQTRCATFCISVAKFVEGKHLLLRLISNGEIFAGILNSSTFVDHDALKVMIMIMCSKGHDDRRNPTAHLKL